MINLFITLKILVINIFKYNIMEYKTNFLTLDNGIKVLLVPTKGTKLIDFMLSFRVGSDLETTKPNTLEIGDLEEGTLKDFYKESKKVDNKKIKEFFNYQFIYPSYKDGLDNIVDDFI